jgi:hypothetical protein
VKYSGTSPLCISVFQPYFHPVARYHVFRTI